MPTALVTGIRGQDGGYLAEQLVADHWRIIGVVRPQDVLPDHLAVLEHAVTYVAVDLLDKAAVTALIDDTRPDVVYNLAGVSSVAHSWLEPARTSRVNGEAVAILLEVLWQRHEAGCPIRILQASSAEIFAGSSKTPQNEMTPILPQNPYGATKAFAHHLIQVYRARGLFAANAILYNHESPRRPNSFVTRKITSAVAKIADGQQVDLVLGKLDSRRDWGWAPDYVRGMTLAVRHTAPSDWVFATGVATSVEDLVTAAFAHIGISDWHPFVRTEPALTRPGDALELVGDSSRAHSELGWAPTLGIADILGRMVDADRGIHTG